MPGRLPSEEPAIEGPARMKAKPKIKLMVRIGSLRFGSRRCAPFVGNWIADGCFRISAWKQKMVSSFRRIVSSEQIDETFRLKTSMISAN
jgi:hypothetical protein